jgi:hypothetical protein
MAIPLTWTGFENFFRLYADLKRVSNLIYVIGETHHGYIGSVGCKSGSGGLAVRYEQQYVDRSRAIFGMDTPRDQPAFAGRFKADITDPSTIREVEELVQWTFLHGKARNQAVFSKRPWQPPTIDVEHFGTPPSFLNVER